MLVMIDNYDSFTFNLVQYFGQLGQTVKVFRNDRISVDELEALRPDYLVVSPGPCTPNEAGVSVAAVSRMAGKIPVLGVCLGHQCIGQAFGGHIVHAGKLMHGKTSLIHHTGVGVFDQLPSPFQATRYHSLVIEKATVPACFSVTASAEDDDEIMAIKHREWDVQGLQFHPESIETHHGHALLKNFLKRK